MSKEEIVNKLVEIGYEAVLMDYPVITLSTCKSKFDAQVIKLSKILKELGYKGSWGARLKVEYES